MAIRKSSSSGIPFGNNANRPANPQIGQPYFNGEESRLELYTSATGWQNIIQETPAVVSVVGQLNETTSSTIQINGTNFAVGAVALVVGSNGVETSAITTTIVSVVEISATFPALSPSYEPYDVKVVNPSNLYGVLYDSVSVNNQPAWSTPSGTIGTFTELQTVSVTVAATDAADSTNSPLSYSVVSGSLPPGLSISSSGVISGTLSDNVVSNTTYSFTIAATDGRNTAVTRAFSITIEDRSPSWSTAATLPTFTRNVAYSTTVVATDDDAGEITYSLVSGSLPTGLSLSSAGVISGTPTSSLTATFTIRATVTASGAIADRAFTIPNVGPTWTTTSPLSSAPQNVSYSQTMVATDDSGNNPTYSLVSGSLPTGLSLSSAGVISGTPTLVQSTTFTIRATDANGNTADRSFQLSVVALGATLYQTPGTYSWTAPAGVTSVSAVCIGGGGSGFSGHDSNGGGGGSLGWKNNIAVTPGQSYTVVVGAGGAGPAANSLTSNPGGQSYFINTSTVQANGGAAGAGSNVGPTGNTGGYVGEGGGIGGYGMGTRGGGGGAAGYTGNGGMAHYAATPTPPTPDSGAGSGGISINDLNGSAGGGVGVYGKGATGVNPEWNSSLQATWGNGAWAYTESNAQQFLTIFGGKSGSGGTNPVVVPNGLSVTYPFRTEGGSFGGGGGGAYSNNGNQGGKGGGGAVRIVWGPNRSFPSTNVGQNYLGASETVI